MFKYILALLILLFSHTVFCQFFNRPVYDTVTVQGVRYNTALSGLVSTNSQTPFWLRSNQFGSVPIESPAALMTMGTKGLWGNSKQNRKPYIQASIEAIGNLTRNSRLILPEVYTSIRLGHGEIYVGRRKEINGITDTLLTSGSYAWSGNAIPITQIRLGTKDYAPLKFTKDVISVNAFYSHGWFTNTDSMQNVYFHAKALYVRIGKPSWKVKLYGGMSHYAQWGGYSKYLKNGYADNGQLATGWSAYLKALWPKKIEESSKGSFNRFDTLNRSGNHLGSIDVALELTLHQSNLLLYVQRPWEDMSGVVFGNLPDGLYGVRWKNQGIKNINHSLRLNQLTLEFLTTRNQSGPKFPKGHDDYFNNHQYMDGWTHSKRVIGTPFFTRWMESNPKWYDLPAGRIKEMISNNSINLLHLGINGTLNSKIGFNVLLSQSWNYGRTTRPDPVISIKQFSSLITTTVPLDIQNSIKLNMTIALDKGDWLPTQVGGIITIQKNGWF